MSTRDDDGFWRIVIREPYFIHYLEIIKIKNMNLSEQKVSATLFFCFFFWDHITLL